MPPTPNTPAFHLQTTSGSSLSSSVSSIEDLPNHGQANRESVELGSLSSASLAVSVHDPLLPDTQTLTTQRHSRPASHNNNHSRRHSRHTSADPSSFLSRTSSGFSGDTSSHLQVDDEGDPDDEEDGSEGEPSLVGGPLRWSVLAMACLLMFGNYYAYDIPAALNRPLQKYLDAPDDTYQYHLNLFYSLYSFPNIILPFFGGWMVDRFGTRRVMTVLSIFVCVGQLCFSLGISLKTYWIMHFGRVLFGIGGESLQVAQSRITTKWFKGKELAFALGVNLSVARLGTVLTDFVSPYLALSIGSVPFAAWFGFVSCFISLVAGLVLNVIDAVGTKPSRWKEWSQSLSSLCIMLYGGGKPSGRSRRTNVAPPLAASITEGFNFPLPFWQICLVMCLMYATVVPFNTILSAFLQTRWFPGDPRKSSQVMSIPDFVSAILVPFAGTFVDLFGRRVKVLLVCGLLMTFFHAMMISASVATLSSPIPLLLLLGGCYSLLLTFWPCIPVVVTENSLATAFGLATSAQNLSLTIFPIFVAALVTGDPTYKNAEMFFTFMSSLGVLVCLWMCDGGSIPKRHELVKTKSKDPTIDRNSQTVQKWNYCTLSKEPLKHPVVACRLGSLYNKERVIEFLLDRNAFGEGEKTAAHLNSIKDVITLNLTPNPSLNDKPTSSVILGKIDEQNVVPQWVCPVTMKEMSGKYRFVFNVKCGCVLSEQAVKEVPSSTCLKCNEPYNSEEDLIPINSTIPAEIETLKSKLEKLKVEQAAALAAKKAAKAAKKAAKSGESAVTAVGEDGIADAPVERPDKKRKHDSSSSAASAAKKQAAESSANARANINMPLPDLTSKVSASQSEAIKSLYKKDPTKKETYLTMGTFTRYA
ncbi:hypothetical protein HDV05_003268 [Chytridiales sp. JEL 0842]|nr:hypothetical protein HDV05_003268 [Chytridiales sp. JEL 0842]